MLSVFIVNCTFKNGIGSFFVENLRRILFMPKLLQIFQWFFAFVSTFNIAHFITILSLLVDQTVSDASPCQSVSLIFTRNRVHAAHVFILLLYLQFTLHLLVPDQLVQKWLVMRHVNLYQSRHKSEKKKPWDCFICQTLYYVHVALTRSLLYFFQSSTY